VQLIPTTAFAIGGDIWRAVTVDRSLLGCLLIWSAGRGPVYQLNLVFTDGVRLNLVNWGRWGASERAVTRQLAEFLNVPVTGLETDDGD
jgi:hypothetical protein